MKTENERNAMLKKAKKALAKAKRVSLDKLKTMSYVTLFDFLYDDRYRNILDNNARAIYCFIYRRYDMSIKNGWIDKDGVPYINYKNESLQEHLQMTEYAVRQALKALKECNLIHTERQGQGKPNRIYLLEPMDADVSVDDSENQVIETEDSEGFENFDAEYNQNFDDNSIENNNQGFQKLELSNNDFSECRNPAIQNVETQQSELLDFNEQECRNSTVKNVDTQSSKPLTLNVLERCSSTTNYLKRNIYSNLKRENSNPSASVEIRKLKTQNSKTHPHAVKIYGDYKQVFLTDNEVERLKNKFGQPVVDEYISQLDRAIAAGRFKAKGKHDAIIESWINKGSEDNKSNVNVKIQKLKAQNSKNHPHTVKIYGDYEQVSLTDKEVERLYGKFNQPLVDEYINQLDRAIAAGRFEARGKHDAIIESWINKDKTIKKPDKILHHKNKNRFINFEQRETDYASLEKIEREYLMNSLILDEQLSQARSVGF